MTVNETLLRDVLTYITERPDEHEQDDWAVRGPECGTAMCVAGHAVVRSGYVLNWRQAGPNYSDARVRDVASDTVDGQFVGVLAQRLLGLHDGQADDLFDSENELHDLWSIASEITDGRVSRPVAPTTT